MTDFLLDNEIHVYGIQRTGQHAIISWLIGHFDEVGFKNCMTSVDEKNLVGIEPPFWYFQRGKFDWVETQDFRKVKNFILGTEFSKGTLALNPNLNKNKFRILSNFKENQFSKKRHNIMVIRDPYNHYASVLNWKFASRLKHPKNFSSIWIRYAKAFLGEPSCLPVDKVPVVFDHWFKNEDYRKNISEKLGLDFSDERLNIVMKIGYRKSWGSSFDSMKLKEEAQKMKVLDRSKDIPKDKKSYYKELCKNKEVKKLWGRINEK